MIRKLIRFELDMDRTKEYVIHNLSYGNTLSKELVKLIDFSKGRFFTLLPRERNIENLYEFECGGILPQYPAIKYGPTGGEYWFRPIPTIQDEIGFILLKLCEKQPNLSGIFEDFYISPDSEFIIFLKDFHMVYSYEQEVYYLINRETDLTKVLKCIELSNAIWHSLCILTETRFDDAVDYRIDLLKLQECCLKTKLVMIGAYDGEAYIFWEPLDVHFAS